MKVTHYINGKEEKTYNNVENIVEENKEKYQFFIDNISNSIYITDRLIFERENDEYIIHIEIGDTNNCTIHLKDKDLKFDVKVLEANYQKNDKNVSFEYILETDESKHKLIIEK